MAAVGIKGLMRSLTYLLTLNRDVRTVTVPSDTCQSLFMSQNPPGQRRSVIPIAAEALEGAVASFVAFS